MAHVLTAVNTMYHLKRKKKNYLNTGYGFFLCDRFQVLEFNVKKEQVMLQYIHYEGRR